MAAPDGQAVKASRLSGSSRPVGWRFASRSRHAGRRGQAPRSSLVPNDLRWCQRAWAATYLPVSSVSSEDTTSSLHPFFTPPDLGTIQLE